MSSRLFFLVCVLEIGVLKCDASELIKVKALSEAKPQVRVGLCVCFFYLI